jgi:hypothetical protein
MEVDQLPNWGCSAKDDKSTRRWYEQFGLAGSVKRALIG